MSFYDRFLCKCKEAEISPTTLIKELGISTSQPNYWKNHNTLPKAEYISLIAQKLQTSEQYLIYGTENYSDLSDSERRLIDLFRKIPSNEQTKLITRAEIVAEQYDIPSIIKIKCSEYKVSAGVGFDLGEDDSWTEIEIPDTDKARKADFALVITGNSMEPIYHDGDIVLVKQKEAIDKGDIGIFRLDGQGFIKKFGGDRLISLNAEYSDILFSDYDLDDIQCVGEVIGRV